MTRRRKDPPVLQGDCDLPKSNDNAIEDFERIDVLGQTVSQFSRTSAELLSALT